MDSNAVTFALILAGTLPVELAAKHGLKKLEAMIKEFAAQPGIALSKAVTANYEEWVILLNAWVEYLFEQQIKLAGDVNALRARAEEIAAKEETQRVLTAFAFEAMREVLPNRREMLAAAAAALTLLDMPVEDKARCERALRNLDPRHVRELYGLSRVASMYFEMQEQRSLDNVRHGVWQRLPDREVLVAAGCVQFTPLNVLGPSRSAATGSVEITRTGDLVLRVLLEYVKRSEIVVVPGREAPRGARSEGDARSFLRAELPQVDEVLIPLARRNGARYDFLDWGRRDQTVAIPVADEPAALQIDDVGEDEALRLRTMKPYDPIRHEQMRIDQKFLEVAIEVSEIDKKHRVRVHGPHDVMRILAEEVDARWNPVAPRS